MMNKAFDSFKMIKHLGRGWAEKTSGYFWKWLYDYFNI